MSVTPASKFKVENSSEIKKYPFKLSTESDLDKKVQNYVYDKEKNDGLVFPPVKHKIEKINTQSDVTKKAQAYVYGSQEKKAGNELISTPVKHEIEKVNTQSYAAKEAQAYVYSSETGNRPMHLHIKNGLIFKPVKHEIEKVNTQSDTAKNAQAYVSGPSDEKGLTKFNEIIETYKVRAIDIVKNASENNRENKIKFENEIKQECKLKGIKYIDFLKAILSLLKKDFVVSTDIKVRIVAWINSSLSLSQWMEVVDWQKFKNKQVALIETDFGKWLKDYSLNIIKTANCLEGAIIYLVESSVLDKKVIKAHIEKDKVLSLKKLSKESLDGCKLELKSIGIDLPDDFNNAKFLKSLDDKEKKIQLASFGYFIENNELKIRNVVDLDFVHDAILDFLLLNKSSIFTDCSYENFLIESKNLKVDDIVIIGPASNQNCEERYIHVFVAQGNNKGISLGWPNNKWFEGDIKQILNSGDLSDKISNYIVYRPDGRNL